MDRKGESLMLKAYGEFVADMFDLDPDSKLVKIGEIVIIVAVVVIIRLIGR